VCQGQGVSVNQDGLRSYPANSAGCSLIIWGV